MSKIDEARQFTHEAHNSIKQVRKYDGLPYWTHTDEVADIVASVGGDEDMVIAANAHDILEDITPKNRQYNYGLIEKRFGRRAAWFVWWLTDVFTSEAYPELNRKARKELETYRIAAAPAEVKTIKLADLLSNTKSIVEHDKDFANVYLREKMALLPYLSDGNPTLLQQASIQALQGLETIGITMPMIANPNT